MEWSWLLGGSYLLLACWWVSHWKHMLPPGMPVAWAIELYLSRVLMSWLYGWIHQYYYPAQSDTWEAFTHAITLSQWWHQNPTTLITYIQQRLQYLLFADFLGVHHTFWQNSGKYILIGLNIIFNLVSGSRYYINCIFFNLLTLPGWLWFARLYQSVLGMSLSAWMIWCHLPAIWFWFSGMHKDALVFTLLAMIGYHTMQWINSRKKKTHKAKYAVFLIGLGMVGLLLFKNFLLLLLIPAWLAWILTAQLSTRPMFQNHKPARVFAFLLAGICVGAYLFCLLLHINPLQVVVQRQQAFYQVGMESQAHSLLPPLPLQPHVLSFLEVLPRALWRVLFLPNPSHQHLVFSLAIQANNMLFLFICVCMLLLQIWKQPFDGWIACGWWIAITYLLLIGYTVPITGAIVRYRALSELLILAPGMHTLWYKFIIKNKI
ncbi:MAG: hypothetical protein K6T34_10310 [Thermoflavifilum sp.]|nr:hypothetical protein [Thermoflavifilum sp.]